MSCKDKWQKLTRELEQLTHIAPASVGGASLCLHPGCGQPVSHQTEQCARGHRQNPAEVANALIWDGQKWEEKGWTLQTAIQIVELAQTIAEKIGEKELAADARRALARLRCDLPGPNPPLSPLPTVSGDLWRVARHGIWSPEPSTPRDSCKLCQRHGAAVPGMWLHGYTGYTTESICPDGFPRLRRAVRSLRGAAKEHGALEDVDIIRVREQNGYIRAQRLLFPTVPPPGDTLTVAVSISDQEMVPCLLDNFGNERRRAGDVFAINRPNGLPRAFVRVTALYERTLWDAVGEAQPAPIPLEHGSRFLDEVDYANRWDRDHPEKGERWEDNPIVIVTEGEEISFEEASTYFGLDLTELESTAHG